MRKRVLAIVSLCLLAACRNDSAMLGQDGRTVEYQIQDNEFAVVVVQENGMRESEAKKEALESVAVLTQKNNYRYFEIESEDR